MSQSLEEQLNTLERALGERMIIHALTILRVWINELGENNPYEQAFSDIQVQYDELFRDWLVGEDGDSDEQLNRLTGDAYRLMDAVYASLRIQRGLSPLMQSFNPRNPQSVMHYFSACLRLRDTDVEWVRGVMDDASQASIALMAVAAIAKCLRECFSERSLGLLIEGINATNNVVAEQCLANAMMLLVHYDVRIDYFPELQQAFLNAIGDGENAFETLCAMIRSSKMTLRDMLARKEISYEDLPEELRDLLSATGSANDISGIASWVPSSESEYMSGLIQILPDTWLGEVLVPEDDYERQRTIEATYLSIGKMDLVWDHLEPAEKWLLNRLRSDHATAMDYINYAHCLLLRGDRMMAFENYRQARNMCKSSKEFFALFRPDRRELVDRGIPVEQVYLIEDQLLKGDA